MPSSPSSLVVHEWGTFTAIAGADGRALYWHPLSVPSDLPSFVHRGDHGGKGELGGTIRMETPVVYVYSDVPRILDVEVQFAAGGVMTEWYPAASRETGMGLRWTDLRVDPAATGPLPDDGSQSHYYPARIATSDLLSTPSGEQDSMLFYRGVASFELDRSARVDARGVHTEGAGLVVERQGDRLGLRAFDAGRTTVPRPLPAATVDEGLARLAEMLTEAGLTEEEAAAMLDTWDDTWFEEGLRVLYVVPRPYTDRVLPLTITPAPTELERVLVGRIELLSPELLAQVQHTVDTRDPQAAAAHIRERWPRVGRPALATIPSSSRVTAVQAAVGY